MAKTPTARLVLPVSATVGTPVRADGSQSVDGQGGGGLRQFAFDMGDGATHVGKDTAFEHVYGAPGSYVISLTVKNKRGLTDTQEQTLDVRASFPNPIPIPPLPPVEGGGVVAASTSHYDVQKAIDAASDGHTVTIPRGESSWSGAETAVLDNKDIRIIGAGEGQTVINGHDGTPPSILFFVNVSSPSKGAWQLLGMTLGGTVTNSAVKVNTAGAFMPAGRFRAGRIHFNFPTKYNRHFASGAGVACGVLHHNTHDSYGGIVVSQQWGLNSEDGLTPQTLVGAFALTIPTGLGTDSFLFVEDSQFTMHNPASTGFIYDSSGGGGRVVLRHNGFTGPMEIYNHWARGGEVCAQVLEIYRNLWTLRPGDVDPGDGVMRLESGTGVFFGNGVNGWKNGNPYVTLNDRRAGGFGGESSPILGRCDGTKPHDGNAGDPAAPGWPAFTQIGRGYPASPTGAFKQPSEPFAMWDNGPIRAYVDPVAYIKQTPHPNGEVDYTEGIPKPGYVPFAYPHPLAV